MSGAIDEAMTVASVVCSVRASWRLTLHCCSMNETHAATRTATVVMIATLATRAWKGGLFRSRIRGPDIVNVRGFTALTHGLYLSIPNASLP